MSEKKKNIYKGKTVLLVDDNIDLLTQIKNYLETLGMKVTTAESQADAEKLIAENDFNLAIFDLVLEHYDSGFILGYWAKKKNPAIPVIMITSVTSKTGIQFDAASEDARSWAKADVILDKDIRFEQLEREIRRLLK